MLADLGIVQPGFFCLAVLLLNLTPGPDTAFVVAQSVAHGRRAGLMSVFGISTGCIAHTFALALGLSALVAASAGAFTVIKVAGAAYLVFLGTRMLVATSTKGPSDVATRAVSKARSIAPPAGRRIFVQGLLTNLLNPKVVLFFLSFLPQFVSSASASKPYAFLVLGVMLVVLSTIHNGAIAWLAGGITHRIHGVPRVRTWLERSVGAAFIALGVRLVLVER